MGVRLLVLPATQVIPVLIASVQRDSRVLIIRARYIIWVVGPIVLVRNCKVRDRTLVRRLDQVVMAVTRASIVNAPRVRRVFREVARLIILVARAPMFVRSFKGLGQTLVVVLLPGRCVEGSWGHVGVMVVLTGVVLTVMGTESLTSLTSRVLPATGQRNLRPTRILRVDRLQKNKQKDSM